MIIGGAKDDRVYLSEGGDTLNGMAGADTIDGSKLQNSNGITVDLRGAQSISTGDSIANFEHAVGTSGNDILMGNDDDNRLQGKQGRDVLYGFGGDDTLVDKQCVESSADLLAGFDGHNDVAEIGNAQLTGTFQSPALLGFLGIPAGGFLSFTRADGSTVHVHESTETITTDGESRKWYEWYGDAVQLPDPGVDPDVTTVALGQNEIYAVPSQTTALTDAFLQAGNQQMQSIDMDTRGAGTGAAPLIAFEEMTVDASTWEGSYAINRVARASAGGDDLQGRQLDIDPTQLPASQAPAIAGSILEGSDQGETLRGLAGWDILDATDEIRILGVSTDELSFVDASAHGVQGIGIYAGGALEALYTGGDMSSDELAAITTGDNSEAVMNKLLWSYRFGAEAPPLV